MPGWLTEYIYVCRRSQDSEWGGVGLMLMLSGVKTIIYIQMVATVMLLCKFGNYILSATACLALNQLYHVTRLKISAPGN